MGWAPGRPARLTKILSEQEGVEPTLGGLEIAEGIFTRAAEIADGCVFHRRDIDGGEVTGAHQPGPWHGITAVGFHAVAGLFRHESGRHHPTRIAFLAQIALEPVPPGPRFVDTDELCGRGLPVADELIKVTMAGANRAQGDELGAVVLGHGGDGDRVLMDIQTNIEWTRRMHG
jgi:hypothetical protein